MSSIVARAGWLLALILIAVAGPARAADSTPPLTEQNYLEELPVVLTPARLSQRVDTSPLPITIINRQMIQASGALTIEDVLRLVPGMLVGHDSGNQAFVTYSGFADRYARRMQVLVDGRSVYSPSFGGVDWSSLPVALEDVERIEVVRGPDAAAYGANAFLGVINVITRPAKDEQGGYAKIVAGSDHLNRVVARDGNSTGNLDYRITAVSTGDHGLNITDGTVDGALTNGYVDNKQTSILSGRFDYQTDKSNQWSFQFGDSYGWRAQGGPLNIFYPPHRLNSGWNFQQLDWHQDSDDGDGLSFKFYHQLDQTSERLQTLPVTIPSVGVLTGDLNYDIRSNRYDAELQQVTTLSDGLRTVWGIGTRLDQVLSQSYLGRSTPISDHEYRLFGHGEWHMTHDFYTNIGAMLEHADFGGSAVSPNASLNYILAPGRTLRLSASSATRYPVAIEEASNQSFSAGPVIDQILISSGGLGPERIRTVDFGYVGDLGSPALWIDTRVFHSRIRDLIAYYNIPFPTDNYDGKAQNFINRDSADLDGAEFQLNYNPTLETRLVINYAYLNITSSTVNTSAPHHDLSALLIHNLSGGIDLSAAFYFTSHMYGLDTGTYIGAQRRLDLKLSAPFTQLSDSARFSITLQSVLGSYQDFKYVNEFEPTILLGLDTNF
ncbi:MAG: TonB-dependent receptor plug domain-containing protein [Gammaproteobacteria bacterium]